MNLDPQDIRLEDIEELRSLLAPYDQKILLPDSLKSDNLLKLLPEEEVKPEKTWITWLLSSNGVSILSAAAILVLAIIIVPRVFSITKNQEATIPSAALAAPESAYTEVMAVEVASDDAPTDINASEADTEVTLPAYAGEDLSGYAQDTATWTASDSEEQELAEQSTGFVGGQGGTGEREAVASEASLLAESKKQASDSVEAFSSTPEGAASLASSPILSNSTETYLTTNGQYNIYVRSLAKDVSEFPDSTQVLVLKDRQDKLQAEIGLTQIDNVYYGAASSNEIAIIGSGTTGAFAQVYAGISNTSLNLQTSVSLLGVYLEGRVTSDYLYCLSTLASGDQIGAMEQVALDGGQGDGVLVITSIPLSGGSKKETAIVGLDPNASFVLGDTALTMSYTNTAEKRVTQEFQLTNGALVQ